MTDARCRDRSCAVRKQARAFARFAGELGVRDEMPGRRQIYLTEPLLGGLTAPDYGSISTPGFMIPRGSRVFFAAFSAAANRSGRCRSYQGRCSRPTA